MGRSPCCEKLGLKKGPWTPEEDQKLLAYIEEHGHGCWRALPTRAGLQRCGKSCRLRWTNYLRPDIKRGKFSVQEEQTIIQLHALLGNRWSAIASHLPKRTDNEIKNFWNTHLKKRLAKMGIDPVTHKPRCDALSSADSHASRTTANLSHMAQWESARLEAEARLVRESKLLRLAASTSLTTADVATAASASASASRSAASTPFQLPSLDPVASLPVELHKASSSAPTVLPPCFDVLRAWQGAGCKSTRGIGDGQSGRDAKIDLESPTSTLSFTESVLTVGVIGLLDHHNSSTAGRQCAGPVDDEERGEETEGEEVDWKCVPKPMQLLDAKERTESFVAAAFTVDSSSVFGADNVSSWLNESPKTGTGSADASAIGHFGDGFTETLLNNSDDRNSSEDGGRYTGKGNGENDEENKNYWNSILNLVSSVSPSNPPDCILV